MSIDRNMDTILWLIFLDSSYDAQIFKFIFKRLYTNLGLSETFLFRYHKGFKLFQ